MTTRIRATPTFERAARKLHTRDKKALDDAVREIAANPDTGVAKKGDLAGVYVHKFKINKQEVLLSYQYTPDELILLSPGSHENFYRNLKR
ncbi:type II toxin-antitoxin system RelE/ParE family toxin [Paraburkholderia sartisoli]|uniref:ParE-like toxin of type II toxin-antitoxin system n=1 Tax=Paraburkholderia sartisoli TaxID=83784 RepID=A0A1H4H3B7_9BURK|nr:type II toxin-antitoxin system RelE/ParE family toxin [Paraburkholderia sartisoli]SEB16309.1 ParE-like toxin of type II toxin-antitoxin system [Paraburkholderia sartisoli]